MDEATGDALEGVGEDEEGDDGVGELWGRSRMTVQRVVSTCPGLHEGAQVPASSDVSGAASTPTVCSSLPAVSELSGPYPSPLSAFCSPATLKTALETAGKTY